MSGYIHFCSKVRHFSDIGLRRAVRDNKAGVGKDAADREILGKYRNLQFLAQKRPICESMATSTADITAARIREVSKTATRKPKTSHLKCVSGVRAALAACGNWKRDEIAS